MIAAVSQIGKTSAKGHSDNSQLNSSEETAGDCILDQKRHVSCLYFTFPVKNMPIIILMVTG